MYDIQCSYSVPVLATDVPTPQANPWATIEPNPPIIPPDCWGAAVCICEGAGADLAGGGACLTGAGAGRAAGLEPPELLPPYEKKQY